MSDSSDSELNLSLGADNDDPFVAQKEVSRTRPPSPGKWISGVPITSVYTKPITDITSSNTSNSPVKQIAKSDINKSIEKDNLVINAKDEKNRENKEQVITIGLRKPTIFDKILNDMDKSEPTFINRNYDLNIEEKFNNRIAPLKNIVTETYTKKPENQPIRSIGSYTPGNYGVIEEPVNPQSIFRPFLDFLLPFKCGENEILNNPKPGKVIIDEQESADSIGEYDEENIDDVNELDYDEDDEREFLKDALIESNKQYVKCQIQFEEKITKCASRMVCFVLIYRYLVFCF
jgi:hypothetical protein